MTGAERLVLVVLAAALVVCALASRPGTPEEVRTTRMRISAGDTLWAIAEQNAIQGFTTAQTADFIARLNGLGTSTLVPGRELEVPVAAATTAYIASR